jgi:WD40 repeat protein
MLQPFIATGGDDARVCVWSRRTRELLLQFTEHVKPVLNLCLDVKSPSLLHSVGADRGVFTYDLKTEKRLVGHQMTKTSAGSFTCLSQRVDSEQELVTGCTDGVVFFWDCDVPDAVDVRRAVIRCRVWLC